jgi:hypothetical protein
MSRVFALSLFAPIPKGHEVSIHQAEKEIFLGGIEYQCVVDHTDGIVYFNSNMGSYPLQADAKQFSMDAPLAALPEGMKFHDVVRGLVALCLCFPGENPHTRLILGSPPSYR